MRLSHLIAASVVVCAASICSRPLDSQQPTPAQVKSRLESNSDLANQLRDEIARRALTPEQVRARLRAAGYPDSLLDNYLPGGTQRGIGQIPRDSLIDAAVRLGLVDSAAIRGLRADTARSDSARRRAVGLVDSLPIFGLDVFRQETSRFEPALAGGVGEDYRIGPGDVLALIITGETEKAYSLDVTRDGFILVPNVGQTFVANLTLAQARTVLLGKLRQAYSSISLSPNASTRFYLTVSRLHTNQVFVLGEVIYPGSYQISSVGTVLSALYAAGGPNDNGTLRHIQIQRGGKVATTVDLYDYLVEGNAANDLRLESGDVVFVGIHGGRASIRGEVARPAVYELVPGETLPQLIQAAGGFTSSALTQRILVRRILPPEQREPGGRDRVVLDVAPSNFAGTTPPFVLLAGDRIQVFGVAGRERNMISVFGDVWTPGRQGFKPGMKLSDALKAAGGVQSDIYLDEVLISRLEADRTGRSIHAQFADSLGNLRSDPFLQEDDSIRVYARSEFAPARFVAISGAVKDGGRYPYRIGMTLRELLLSAGGPLESADLREAEIARLPLDRRPGELARTFRVPLDSSYVIDRLPDTRTRSASVVASGASNASAAVDPPDIVLEPYDNVLVFRQPEWRILGSVWVDGEVRYPGAYTITTRSEKLAEIIARAGGLTTQADPAAAIFFRRADSAGRIGIDLNRAIRETKSADNFVVAPGDSLFVGTYKPYVQVKGAVNSPVTVAYSRGKAAAYYVSAAGGFSQTADATRVYVRQANGSVESRQHNWMRPDKDPVPLPGATVIVPEQRQGEKADYAAVATVIAPILASLITIVTLIIRR